MKLINKISVQFVDGWLVDTFTNQVLPLTGLADEVNSLVTLDQHITFAVKNEAKIKALSSGETIEFKRPGYDKAKLESGLTAATPLKDKADAEAEALALEWLGKQKVDDVDKMLAKFTELAQFLERDYILYDEEDEAYHGSRFLVDPNTITREFVVDTITKYHDPDVRKLVKAVVVTG